MALTRSSCHRGQMSLNVGQVYVIGNCVVRDALLESRSLERLVILIALHTEVEVHEGTASRDSYFGVDRAVKELDMAAEGIAGLHPN